MKAAKPQPRLWKPSVRRRAQSHRTIASPDSRKPLAHQNRKLRIQPRWVSLRHKRATSRKMSAQTMADSCGFQRVANLWQKRSQGLISFQNILLSY